MLALGQVEKDTDPVTNLPWDVVTDPKNQFNFVTPLPTTNWAARTLAADQAAYYKPLDDREKTAGGDPVSRAGHMWRVKIKDSPSEQEPDLPDGRRTGH